MKSDARSVVRQRISTEFMIEISNYCDGDMDISSCRRKKQYEIFRYNWAVGMESPCTQQFTEIALFNTPQFKLSLRKFLQEAHDALDRFRFFGFYYAKDMQGWFQSLVDSAVTSYRLRQEALQNNSDNTQEAIKAERQHETLDPEKLSDNDDEEETEEIDETGQREILETLRQSIVQNLPFGVIPLSSSCGSCDFYGHYYLERHRELLHSRLVFECTDELLARRYNFGVYDAGAQFILCSDPQCKVRCREDDQQQFKTLCPDDLIPQTPYLDLYIQKSLLDEAEETQFDANSMLAYPEVFLVAKLPQEKRVENVSAHVLSIEQSMLGAQLHDNAIKHNIALDTAGRELENIRQNTNNGLIRARKVRYNRPSLKDGMEPVSAMVDISQNRPPSTILNVAQLRQQYENTICLVMNMPYFFFKQHTLGSQSGGGGQSGGGKTQNAASTPYNKQLELSQKLLEDEIKKEHAVLSEIFKVIYSATFVELFGAPLVSLYSDGTEEPALSFDRVIVKNEESLLNLLKFHQAGVIKDNELRPFIESNYGLNDDLIKSNYHSVSKNGGTLPLLEKLRELDQQAQPTRHEAEEQEQEKESEHRRKRMKIS
jgi:hypothetical protein